jgi:hypothetical protein
VERIASVVSTIFRIGGRQRELYGSLNFAFVAERNAYGTYVASIAFFEMALFNRKLRRTDIRIGVPERSRVVCYLTEQT